MEEPCRNCGAELNGPYCSACGQKRIALPLRMGELIRDWLAHALSFETGFLRTLRDLTLRPGATVREYLDGKRRTHCSPARYFFTMLAAYLLVFALVGGDPTAAFAGFGKQLGQGDSEVNQRFFDLLGSTLRILVFLKVPALAATTLLLYRKARRTFAEHLAFALYAYGYMLALGVAGLVLLWAGVPHAETACSVVLGYAYLLWAVARFYGNWWIAQLVIALAEVVWFIVVIFAVVAYMRLTVPA